jgi:hypothetical protein
MHQDASIQNNLQGSQNIAVLANIMQPTLLYEGSKLQQVAYNK